MMHRLLITLCLLAASQMASSSDCHSDSVGLTVLGSGGPELDDGRASSSYLLSHNGRSRVLIDAGGGSAANFEKAGARVDELDALLLTHLHVDHSAEVPVYLKAAYFTRRRHDLVIAGPDANALMPATSAFVNALFGPQGAYPYLADYLPGKPGRGFKLALQDMPVSGKAIKRVTLGEQLSASAIPVHHGPIAAVAWRLDIAGCSVTFSGDMSNRWNNLARLARNSDVLVLHNAIPEGARGAAVNLHMPPSEMARIIADAKPGKVLISHRMNRTLHTQQETLSAIRNVYAGPVVFAEDLLEVGLADQEDRGS